MPMMPGTLASHGHKPRGPGRRSRHPAHRSDADRAAPCSCARRARRGRLAVAAAGGRRARRAGGGARLRAPTWARRPGPARSCVGDAFVCGAALVAAADRPDRRPLRAGPGAGEHGRAAAPRGRLRPRALRRARRRGDRRRRRRRAPGLPGHGALGPRRRRAARARAGPVRREPRPPRPARRRDLHPPGHAADRPGVGADGRPRVRSRTSRRRRACTPPRCRCARSGPAGASGAAPTTPARRCAPGAVVRPHPDACAGDSGGPLVAFLPYSPPSLVGVVSYGTRTCGAGPTAYARTWFGPLQQWLRAQVSAGTLAARLTASGASARRSPAPRRPWPRPARRPRGRRAA